MTLEAGDGDERFGQDFMTDLFGRAQAAKDAALDAQEDARMSSDDAAILAELRRLERMPLPRWMRTE
ncbi:hypothetical protein ABC766_05310 [Methylobacterium fujisawaense]|uniref:hypothetical protein n=1 Tax=Methylobacterium fujisawaense TaxID=107400 RepID=UPI0031F4F4E5